MIKISPSLLSCDFANIAAELKRMEISGADMLHLDVMDGLFVPNFSFGNPVISSIRKCTEMILDTHLMIVEPERYIDRFIDAGSDIITFHIEACNDVALAIDAIHKRGVKAGIAIKPATPIESVYPYLNMCDMILVMTVEPGYGGQALIPYTVDKVKALADEVKRLGIKIDIQVDGGINEHTAKLVRDAGANVLVAGSYVFGADDPTTAVESLKQ